MKNTRNIKSLTVLIAFLLVMGACVGTTLAYLIDKTDSVVNTFNPTEVSTEVWEDPFDHKVKTNVKVANTGTIDAYIRATVVVTWKDAQGNVLGQLPVAGEDYTIEYNTSEQNDSEGNPIGKWTLDTNDGFYYWSKPVAPGATTGILITKCEPLANQTPVGYGLNVEIIAQSIQTEPEDAVNAWKGGNQ